MEIVNSSGGYGADYRTDVYEGKISGKSPASISCLNRTIATGAEVDVSLADPNLSQNLQDVAIDFDMICADPLDTALGSGAQLLLIFATDSTGAVVTLFQTTNGGTTQLATQYRRIFRAVVLETGSGNKNAGIITFVERSGGRVHLHMETGKSNTFSNIYPIPLGKVARVGKVLGYVSEKDTVTIVPIQRLRNGTLINGQDFPIHEGHFSEDLWDPAPISELQDIVIRAEKIGGGATAFLSAIFEITLTDT